MENPQSIDCAVQELEIFAETLHAQTAEQNLRLKVWKLNYPSKH